MVKCGRREEEAVEALWAIEIRTVEAIRMVRCWWTGVGILSRQLGQVGDYAESSSEGE